jgi:N-acetylglutamate synthase-like GNAT family acetyltransferase
MAGTMRIRYYRAEDLPTLEHLQQLAISADRLSAESAHMLIDWLQQAVLEPQPSVFVVRDDDDEMNTWGQAGTLDGVEGELVGYTALRLLDDEHAYHLRCLGTVHPEYRRQNAGRILLVSALNRARMLAAEFEFEAEQEGRPIYFEALLPVYDPAAARLAARFEMVPTDEPVPAGLCLYQRELW